MDFKTCPLIEGEDDSIRLVNLKNNCITGISNLDALTKLIFLDLYNNQVCVCVCVFAVASSPLQKSSTFVLFSAESVSRVDFQITKLCNLEQLQMLRVLMLGTPSITRM